MNQGYNDLGNGLCVFFNEATNEKITINTVINRASYGLNGVELIDDAINHEEGLNLVEYMKVPGTGLGMLLIKIGRAFSRAVGGGSSAE